MNRIVLFVALTLISVPAIADVFKCKTQDGVVYSEQPCAKDATVVSNLAKDPSEEDVNAAKTRSSNDINHVEAYQRKEKQERQARESRQGTRVVGIIVMTRSSSTSTTTTTTTKSFGQNQNSQAQSSQAAGKFTGNNPQAK